MRQLIAGIFCGWFAVSPCSAAEQPDTALEEIVVTAQRRSQSEQDIGVAVTAVNGAELEALRIQQPLMLPTLSPSLSSMNSTTDGTPLFLIRGIGLDDFNTNNSSGVGVYLDDVFASFPGFLTESLFDLDRVEILEGPQGTLYGKNTTGGAINLISKKPTHDFEGYVNVDYSRWETTDLSAAVSGPLTEGIAARLAGTTTIQGEGYQTDIDTGEHYGKLNRGGLRALLDVRLNESAELLLNFHYSYDHSVPSSPSTPNVEALIPPQPFPTAGLLDSPPGGQLVRAGGLPLYKNESGDGVVVSLDWHFAGLTLSSISAFDEFFARSLDNYDGYPAADNNWSKNFQQQQYSEELRLASATGGFIDWILGAEYSANWYHCRDSLDWTFVYGLASDINQGGLALTATNFLQTQKSAGLYAHAETHLSDRLSFVSGLRYSHDVARFDGNTLDPTGLLTYAADAFTGPIVPNTVLASLAESRPSQDVAYRLETDFHLSDKIMLYASLATAYKSGIFYGQPAQVQVDWSYVLPEHVRTGEIGFKGRFRGDSLQLNAALFDSEIRDRQSSLSLWAGPVGTQPLIAGLGNVPRSRIDGAEAEIDWRPLRGLQVHLAGTYLHARVTETLTNDHGLALYTPVAVGQTLPDAPQFSESYLITYERSLRADLSLYGQINDHYVGAEHPYLADPTTFGDGHSLGLRLGLRNALQRWDTSVWVTNLTDTRPLTYAFAGSEGQQVSFYQKPRSVGVSLGVRF